MRYAVLGGDMRFVHLVGLLRESGRRAEGFLQENAGRVCPSVNALSGFDVVIANWPLRLPLSDTKMEWDAVLREIAPESVLLLCGPGFPKQQNPEYTYVNLWKDEDLLRENACLTAEAAAATMAGRIGGPLRGKACMVIGYGRIGRPLTEILLQLGAQAAVVSRTAEKLREIKKTGAEAVAIERLKAALPGRKLIFVTAPHPILNREMLLLADGDAHIMDLASPPYGADVETAREMGMDAWREPGLPGRYCPLRAAQIIFNAVQRWEVQKHG